MARILEHVGKVGIARHGPARQIKLHHVFRALEHALEGLGRGDVPLGHLVYLRKVDGIAEEVTEVLDLAGIPLVDGGLGYEEPVILEEAGEICDLGDIPLVQAIRVAQLRAILEEASQGCLATLVSYVAQVQARAVELAQLGEALKPSLGIGGLKAVALLARKDHLEDLALVASDHVCPGQELGVVPVIHAGDLGDHPGLVGGTCIHRNAHGQDALDLVVLPPGVVVGDEAA